MMGRQFLLGLCLASLTVHASPADSLRVERFLETASACGAQGNDILFFAKGFQGTPYLGGTLEAFPSERLVVRTDSVDCTTFVEYVTALVLTHREKAGSFASFKEHLQQLRYRNGEIKGYVSRLHYFSDWIRDNARKGLVEEVTLDSPHQFRCFTMDFMSVHASLYPMLADRGRRLSELLKVEAEWRNFKMPYIPKRKLGAGKEVLKVQDGDILALATNVKGLDVVHVGFAVWVDGKLHLLHASSAKKCVWLDPVPLVDYSARIQSHIGIRVIRICR